MENKNLQKLAAVLSDCLEERERENGEKFIRIKDGLKKSTEEKVRNLIHAAHNNGDFMPDDFRYEIAKKALDAIASGELTEDDTFGFADDTVNVYSANLLKWVSSNLTRAYYVDEAVDEYGYPDNGLFAALSMGQAREIEEIASIVLQHLTDWND